MNRFVKRCLPLLCLFLGLAPAARAQEVFRLPCDAALSPFLAVSEHEISKEIDLSQAYRMQIDDWEADIPVSGSLIVLDMQVMLISLRFSEDFDYEAKDMRVPESILLANQDPNVSDDTGTPPWRAAMYPDADDPYAFHYIGTWNWPMACVRFYGDYADEQGDPIECFSLRVALF